MKFKKKVKIDEAEFKTMQETMAKLLTKVSSMEKESNKERLLNYYDTNRLYKVNLEPNFWHGYYEVANVTVFGKEKVLTFEFENIEYEIEYEPVKVNTGGEFIKIKSIREAVKSEI